MELFFDGGALEQIGQCLDGVLAGPTTAHRGSADPLDQIEDVGTGLLAQDIADQSPE